MIGLRPPRALRTFCPGGAGSTVLVAAWPADDRAVLLVQHRAEPVGPTRWSIVVIDPLRGRVLRRRPYRFPPPRTDAVIVLPDRLLLQRSATRCAGRSSAPAAPLSG